MTSQRKTAVIDILAAIGVLAVVFGLGFLFIGIWAGIAGLLVGLPIILTWFGMRNAADSPKRLNQTRIGASTVLQESSHFLGVITLIAVVMFAVTLFLGYVCFGGMMNSSPR